MKVTQEVDTATLLANGSVLVNGKLVRPERKAGYTALGRTL